MDDRTERFAQAIRDEWTDPALVEAYRKYAQEEATWGERLTPILLDAAALKPGMNVLDLASGHGEPALDIARLVAPGGHVTATDQGPLLEIARQRAAAAGIDNITFRLADAHALPFPDGTFDRVTCRFGAMYFADPMRAFGEIRRVLKPGGRVALLVWGDAKDTFFDTLVGPIFSRIDIPDPEPGEPSPLAFAEPDTTSRHLRDAGFVDVAEREEVGVTRFVGTPERYWEYFIAMAPPFAPLLEQLGDQKDVAIGEVLAGLRAAQRGDDILLPARVIAATAQRP